MMERNNLKLSLIGVPDPVFYVRLAVKYKIEVFHEV